MRLSRRAPLRAFPLAAVGLAVVLALLLAACGGSSTSPSAPSSAPATKASTSHAPSSASAAKASTSHAPSSGPAAKASTSHAPSSAPAAKASTSHAPSSAPPTAPTTSAAPKATASPSPAALPVAPGAGALPQTSAFPSTRSVAFSHAMADLWLAVSAGNARFALAAFFPEAAYKQVKAIPYPVGDWQDRLWYDFALDVRAAHGLLAPGARLVRVIVPTEEAAWVYPGACYNSVGYWHVGGARVVYLEHGQDRSFGIASLISWRGVWYVIHFGEVLRPVVTGVVDQPAVGSGIPGPPGGC